MVKKDLSDKGTFEQRAKEGWEKGLWTSAGECSGQRKPKEVVRISLQLFPEGHNLFFLLLLKYKLNIPTFTVGLCSSYYEVRIKHIMHFIRAVVKH